MGFFRCFLLLTFSLLFVKENAEASVTSEQEEHFHAVIAPILKGSCYECHSHSRETARGGLVVDSLKSLLKGGDNGPALILGDPDSSLLILAIERANEETAMPPKEENALSDEKVLHLRKWIEDGAPWPESARTAPEPLTNEEIASSHWAYQSVAAPEVPEIKDLEWREWVRNPIDHFIAKALENSDVKPGLPADDRTLIRRSSYSLLGLPPTPAEVQAFQDEPKYQALIERLLSSSEYGRKWGRHWLDVVRYADTAGDNADFPIPQMSLYRDYVIQSFNEDLPFDEFIKEQIAGDLMPSGADDELYRRRIIATSFVANSMRYCDDLRNDMHLVISDTIDTVGQSFLGMQLSCAKCHNHKYDPIPATDYYGIYGYFASTRYPYAGREGRQVPVNLVSTSRDPSIIEQVEKINKSVLHDLISGGRIKLTEGKGLKIVERLQKQEALGELAFAIKDSGEGIDEPIHKRGEPDNKGITVPRGFLSAISNGQKPDIPEGASGRLQFAEWIASSANPLTARVIVNRIWGWHFGTGLVRTPNNFGMSGEPPSHPELLDYLTDYFIKSGWSVKALHRLIMSSASYQQAWRPESEGLVTDSSNRLLWRFDRRRLTAEELRDSALAVSGRLKLENPGPHPFPKLGYMSFTQHRPFEDGFEHDYRSVFLMTSRIRKQEFLTLFDGADPTQSTGQRRVSTVPLQALYLLNNPRVHEFVDSLASRIEQFRGTDDVRLSHAFELVYQRRPSVEESDALLNHLAILKDGSSVGQSAWEVVAQALLLSNEFIYID